MNDNGIFSHSPFKRWGVTILGVGLGMLVTTQIAQAEDLETLKPGVLQVAIEPYMPYTALKDDKLLGLDSDILDAVAKKLGLKIEATVKIGRAHV